MTRKFTNDLLLDDCRAVLETRAVVEREVRADNGHYYLAARLPYLTADRHLEGVVITFIDLTDRKRAADLVDEARLYAESIVATVRRALGRPGWPFARAIGQSLILQGVRASPRTTWWTSRFSRSIGHLGYSRRCGVSFEEMLDRKSEIVDFELALPSDQRGHQRTHALEAPGRSPVLMTARA